MRRSCSSGPIVVEITAIAAIDKAIEAEIELASGFVRDRERAVVKIGFNAIKLVFHN